MRGKVISRFAAGTFSVCLIYSLVIQALNTESSAQEVVTAWLVTPVADVEPEETEAVTKKTQEEQWFFPQEGNSQDSNWGYPGSDYSDSQFFRGGRLVMWDMTPADLAQRQKIDRIETLRDPSHTREMSKEEMQKLYADTGLTLTLQEELEIPVSLEGWMELTKTPEEVRNEIRTMMEKDLSREITTGFIPYRTEEGIFFHHHWVLNVGTK